MTMKGGGWDEEEEGVEDKEGMVEGGWVVEEEFDYDGWVDYHKEDDFVP